MKNYTCEVISHCKYKLNNKKMFWIAYLDIRLHLTLEEREIVSIKIPISSVDINIMIEFIKYYELLKIRINSGILIKLFANAAKYGQQLWSNFVQYKYSMLHVV